MIQSEPFNLILSRSQQPLLLLLLLGSSIFPVSSQSKKKKKETKKMKIAAEQEGEEATVVSIFDYLLFALISRPEGCFRSCSCLLQLRRDRPRFFHGKSRTRLESACWPRAKRDTQAGKSEHLTSSSCSSNIQPFHLLRHLQ